MKLKCSVLGALALISVGSVVGCAPNPAAPAGIQGGIACGGGSAAAAFSPGVRTQSAPNTLTLTAPSSTAHCNDKTGSHITNARLNSASITFPSLSCAGGPDVSGSGEVVIGWSDGSTSTASATATLGGVLTGVLDLHVTSGRFTGASGRSPFVASPTNGDCGSGITGEMVSIEGITLS